MGRAFDLETGFVCLRKMLKFASHRRLSAAHLLGAAASLLAPGLLWHFAGAAAHGTIPITALCSLLACPTPSRKLLRQATEPGDSEGISSDPEFEIIQHLRQILASSVTFLKAKAASLSLFDAETGLGYSWTLPGQQSPHILAAMTDYSVQQPLPGDAWFSLCIRVEGETICFAAARDARRLRRIPVPPAEPQLDPALWNEPLKASLTARVNFGERWAGQIVVANPGLAQGKIHAVRLLQQVVTLAEHSYEAHCSDCGRAAKRERERIARDLHDGITQSLSAAELRIELLRRNAAASPESSAEEVLAAVQQTLRQQVRTVRVQIEQLRSGCHDQALEPSLGELIHNFEADTGITTAFLCHLGSTQISPQLALEVVYIVAEALANVRKHSQATQVEIRLTGGRQLRLTVQNNGYGFGFTGRRSLAELQAAGIGPRMMCERVQAMGGTLLVDSSAPMGPRLEITLPLPGTTRSNGSAAPAPIGSTLPSRSPRSA